MKPTKFIKYVLIGCNLFLKLPRQIKGFRVMIYNQVLISENEEMKKDSKFEWIFFNAEINKHIHDVFIC